MPKQLKLIPYAQELQKLIKVYLKAEQDILDAIAYKRGHGYVDYAETAALERVQGILNNLVDESYKYVPKLIEKQYLYGKQSIGAYASAASFSLLDHTLIQRYVSSLMGTIIETANYAGNNLNNLWAKSVIIGRQEEGPLRSTLLESLARSEAQGLGVGKAQAYFLESVKEQGITGFVDKSGRKWDLRTYAEMATRTASRQATNTGILAEDPEHDLYRISSHATTCKICAPLENRVFSKSGTSPYYPPLTVAFGKIDEQGPDSLDNSYLNIHPNCLHVITKFYEEPYTEVELAEIREFSNTDSNPIDVDPRSQAEIKRYQDKEKGRTKLLNAYKQFERYKPILGDSMPKTFQTFLKHKVANTEKYQSWQKLYRLRNKALKYL